MKTSRLLFFLVVACGVLADRDSDNVVGKNRCFSTQFRCKNGDCIDSELLCDGTADCQDKSDETERECSGPDVRCHKYAFRCNYGACIDGDKTCNGVKDCVDNSDELLPECSHANTPKTPRNQSRPGSACESSQFKCKDGQCISDTLICDGRADCRDKSDETHENCESFNCDGLAFRCDYGGCIDGDLRCNGEKNCVDNSDESPQTCNQTSSSWPPRREQPPSRRPPTPSRPSQEPTRHTPRPETSISALRTPCRVPPQPEHGNWKLHHSQCSSRTNCDVSPGVSTLDPGTYLVYNCDEGYRLDGGSDVFCGPQGVWAKLPKCVVVQCPSLSSPSTQVSCDLNNAWIPCDTYAPIHAVAKLQCRNSYRQDTTVLSSRDTVRCNRFGNWEPQPIRCVPVCGVATGKPAQTLIVNGTLAKINDFPWHATLYMDRNDKIDFICGATIIQADILITAAHCVYNTGTKRAEDASKFYIATGNVFRDYDSPLHDKDIVTKAKVKNIYVHCNYLGLTGLYARDIALLQIDKPFVFSSLLMPICLDPTGSVAQLALSEGNYGRVAGFGRTATGPSSSILQTISVPYVSPAKCKTAAAESERFITLDKFCAGYENGSSVCDGDSGGGLVFNTSGLWHLQGIVSAGIKAYVLGGSRVCDAFAYSLYTQVSYHFDWIQEIVSHIEADKPVPECPP